MVGGNWLKSISFLFLDHLPGFPNYTFLNFQKKIFLLHPSDTSVKACQQDGILRQINVQQLVASNFAKNRKHIKEKLCLNVSYYFFFQYCLLSCCCMMLQKQYF